MAGTREVARGLLARIRTTLPAMMPSEARVAREFLERPDVVIRQSVSEVAAAAGASTATVIRCAQTLGFRGFHDLKLSLAQEIAAYQPTREGEDSWALVRVAAAGAESVLDAVALVDRSAFDSAVVALDRARRVLVVGVGTSAPLAQDAAYRLRAIGLDSEAPADAHHQHVSARLLRDRDVCLAISHTGSTRETAITLRAAREAGAETVLVTSFLRSPMAAEARHVLTAGSREISFRLEAVASRLAHLAVIDALILAVSEADEARTADALDRFSAALTEHRF